MLGIGTDIVQIVRIEAVVERQGVRFVQRILTPVEVEEYDNSRLGVRLLAKRFAAKEAIVKALGTGIGHGVGWQDMTIEHDDKGAPLVTLRGGAEQRAQQLGGSKMLLSLADESDYVVAFAVLVP
ncbi:holo-ACP synthase [Halieaceae bacterium IMCC14734]|uniref:Holo-[acyl-carrier-protein] synthase n=1 Tax=Candidatus Litorirhabdus singularis TaxID=2518993 RepID=A0ABT3TK93_9GAMM|nr:holo-ACP synthase [Candidatus Litorirhabdus singularis]MCX2981839.1 holo-ACP synthase [Candidatus Litorirhabdus singularis]